jgi:hypothetical protein
MQKSLVSQPGAGSFAHSHIAVQGDATKEHDSERRAPRFRLFDARRYSRDAPALPAAANGPFFLDPPALSRPFCTASLEVNYG